MGATGNKAYEEIAAVLEKYGIGTYVIAFNDPDSDECHSAHNGSSAWIAGQAHFYQDLMTRRWNAERLKTDEKP